MKQSFQSLAARIEGCYAELPPSEKAVADLLLDAPGRLALHSATEIAVLAGASKAAVTRCLQRLGYRSFAQARAEVRDAQQWGSPLYLAEPVADAESAGSRSLDAHVAADIELLRRTRASLDDDALQAAARALARARRVVVIGFRNSQLLAGYARTQLGLLRPGVELLPGFGETLAEGLAELGGDDLVVAIGFRRRVPMFDRALDAAQRAGAQVLYLTDPGGGAAARAATWTVRCHCRGASMFDSYVAAFSVLVHLATLLAHVLGEPARKRLQRIERMHGELGDLV